MKTPYEILNIDENASEEAIRIAYKRLAVKVHPDQQTEHDSTAFLELKDAYDLLRNSVTRAEYHRQLKRDLDFFQYRRTGYVGEHFDSIIGREKELAELEGLLTEHRSASVIGLPGIGKTYLVNAYRCNKTYDYCLYLHADSSEILYV